jgi:hypothetical protein
MAKKIPVDQALTALSTNKHAISKANADKWAKRYQKFAKDLAKAVANGTPPPPGTPDMGVAFSFNKKNVQKILKETGAVGLRIYPGINDDKKLTTILVAFDAQGNNITYTEVVVAKAKAGKGLKAGGNDDPDDGLLDDAQSSPPYPAPTLP